METCLNSHISGKWYQIARSRINLKNDFSESLFYLSISCENNYDLLFVGINYDRSKIIKKFSMKIISKKEETILMIKNRCFLKRFRLLLHDKENDILIISDMRYKHILILSKKSSVNHEIMELSLSKIDFCKFDVTDIRLYSSSIID